LEWNPDAQALDLRLQRGSAIVEGPLADSWVKVGTGQHLLATAGMLSLIDGLNTSPPIVVQYP
jgi:hypothetical protein